MTLEQLLRMDAIVEMLGEKLFAIELDVNIIRNFAIDEEQCNIIFNKLNHISNIVSEIGELIKEKQQLLENDICETSLET